MHRKLPRKQFLYAIILLIVMILQMGVKGLHQHKHAEKETISCSDCEQHKVHSGHLLAWDGCSDDCLLCQLISTPFTEVDALKFTPIHVEHQQICDIYVDFCIDNTWHSIKLRGPPTRFSF